MNQNLIRQLFVLLIVFNANSLFAQVTIEPQGSGNEPVEILPGARKLEFRRVDSVTQLQILAGNVRLKQGNTYFNCDSCVINNRLKVFEAFGKVHINDADTANVYSDRLRYLMDTRIAYLSGNVRLTDGNGTLTTSELEYDLNTSIGTYTNGGRVVNGTTVLTSREGFYYADIKDVYFRHNVVLDDPAYHLETDSLLYNTETETARFIAQTLIRDSSGRTIETSEGYYNLRYGISEFGRRPIIRDGKVRITADVIRTDDSTGISQAEGNAVIIDSAQGTTIIAGTVMRNAKMESVMAINKPLMIVEQDEDSIYIAADTLFTARLTDLYGQDTVLVLDTVEGMRKIAISEQDSANRYFEAFRNVRIFSDSLQAASDSLFYSSLDSVFRMYDQPVIWSSGSQITGDTILLYTKNKKADRMKVFNNSFLISEPDPGVYNQVQSTRMDGFFIDGNIDSVRAGGSAQTIYYIQDEDSAYTGINEASAELLDILFRNRELFKVIYISGVRGTIWPMKDKSPSEMRLPGFIWLEERRPKTRFELFE